MFKAPMMMVICEALAGVGLLSYVLVPRSVDLGLRVSSELTVGLPLALVRICWVDCDSGINRHRVAGQGILDARSLALLAMNRPITSNLGQFSSLAPLDGALTREPYLIRSPTLWDSHQVCKTPLTGARRAKQDSPACSALPGSPTSTDVVLVGVVGRGMLGRLSCKVKFRAPSGAARSCAGG
jgi:hypothetical protein